MSTVIGTDVAGHKVPVPADQVLDDEPFLASLRERLVATLDPEELDPFSPAPDRRDRICAVIHLQLAETVPRVVPEPALVRRLSAAARTYTIPARTEAESAHAASPLALALTHSHSSSRSGTRSCRSCSISSRHSAPPFPAFSRFSAVVPLSTIPV